MRISNSRGLGVIAALVALLATSPAMAEQEIKDTISDVEVSQLHGTTQIVLRGAEEPIYTAFMREDPPGLVVELYDVTFEGMESPLVVSGSNVREIAFGEYGDGEIGAVLGRMTVDLERDSDYEVIPSGGEVVVKVWPRNWDASADTGLEEAVPAAPADLSEPVKLARSVAKASPREAVPASPEPLKATEARSKGSAAEPKSASRITKLEGSETRIVIQASGPIDNVDSFLLDSPERLVIDFWGAENGLKLGRYPVNSGLIQQLRVGTHPEKVRLVVDLQGPIESHLIEHSDSGVQIDLTLAGEQAESAPDSTEVADDRVAQQPVAPSLMREIRETVGDVIQIANDPGTKAPGIRTRERRVGTTTGHVASVHFESIAGIDRIVVKSTGNSEPVLVHPDPVTVVLDLPHASIAPDAERRIDTRNFGGPVEQVSAFRTPDVEIEQARIVVKHRGTSRPTFDTREGGWVLEFTHPTLPPAASSAKLPRAAAPVAYPAAPSVAQAQATPVPWPAMEPAQVAEFQSNEAYEANEPKVSPASDGIENASPAAIDVISDGGYSAEKQYSGRRISLDFKDADIASILRLIAEVSDLNIVAAEEVSGNVTIRLVDVPWDQAMDVVLLTKGLGFTRVGNVLRIAPIEVLQQEEESRLAERRAKEKLEDLVVKLQPVNYADVKEVEDMVKRLLSERGTVDVDRRTSTLIIKDIPSVIHESTTLVKAIDTQTPQVLIEAKIVEANLDFSRDLGATWGLGYNALGGQGGAPDFHLGDNPTSLLGSNLSQETMFVASNPIDTAFGTLTAGLLGLADRLQLDLRLQAAETNGTGKVISSPRVLTLDNTEAAIQQGVAIPFQATTENSINTNFVDAVLELKVTPHITADGSIVMKIKVSRNAPEISKATGDQVGIRKNETQTEALVMDGQTMVLGGIYVVSKTEATTGVPFLSDIPIIGAMFSSNSKTDGREELLIFVTPRIVNPRAEAG